MSPSTVTSVLSPSGTAVANRTLQCRRRRRMRPPFSMSQFSDRTRHAAQEIQPEKRREKIDKNCRRVIWFNHSLYIYTTSILHISHVFALRSKPARLNRRRRREDPKSVPGTIYSPTVGLSSVSASRRAPTQAHISRVSKF